MTVQPSVCLSWVLGAPADSLGLNCHFPCGECSVVPDLYFFHKNVNETSHLQPKRLLSFCGKRPHQKPTLSSCR